ncbi:MAG: 50S ribosomal protein L4 [Elusimicrobia bacterium]|nr:50S ribosomal protein L4 [Elusimicrobiota bacterium]
MELDILDLKTGEPSGQKAVVPEGLAAVKVNIALIHETVTAYANNWRRGTHSTLTRSEVQGGGKKPWKQKHTGRARSGSNRSPLWRKGGIIFGPKPRDYSVYPSRAKRRLSFVQAVACRLAAGAVLQLLLVSALNKEFLRASRNLEALSVRSCETICAGDILAAKTILATDKAWARMTEGRFNVN